MVITKKAIQFLFVITLSTNTFAATTGDVGAISSATAGAGRAAVEAGDSAYLNPATLGYLKGYFFATSYGVSAKKDSQFSLSLTDAMKDTLLPTSIGYSQSTRYGFQEDSSSDRTDMRDIRIALGDKIYESWAAGLSAHYRTDRQSVSGLEKNYTQTNLTLAAAVGITEDLSAGLVFDDILPGSSDAPADIRLRAATSLGVAYNYRQTVRVRLDAVSATNNSMNNSSLLGGIESFIAKFLIVRVGYGHNFEVNSDLYSAGIGFQGPKFGIHYAYQSRYLPQYMIAAGLAQEAGKQARHSVDLTVPVW